MSRLIACIALIGSIALPVHALATDARTVEDAAKKTAGVWKFPEYVTSCMKIDAIRKKNLADLRLTRQFDKTLGWVGPALGLTQAAAAAARGQNIDAAQQIGNVSADVVICKAKPVLCPAWAVGRTIGGVFNEMVSLARVDRKTAQEVLEDLYIETIYDRPATARELLRLQAAIDRATARHEATLDRALSCSDPKQTRAGVDALLEAVSDWSQARGSAPLPRSTPPPAGQPVPLPRSTPPVLSCEFLDDTRASEKLMADDPDAYDALMTRCLR